MAYESVQSNGTYYLRAWGEMSESIWEEMQNDALSVWNAMDTKDERFSFVADVSELDAPTWGLLLSWYRLFKGVEPISDRLLERTDIYCSDTSAVLLRLFFSMYPTRRPVGVHTHAFGSTKLSS